MEKTIQCYACLEVPNQALNLSPNPDSSGNSENPDKFVETNYGNIKPNLKTNNSVPFTDSCNTLETTGHTG